MTFGSTFGRVLSPTFQPNSQAVAGGGWWDLNGTITSCVAAYQAKGAASYAASLVNLANVGTYDADDEGTHAPDWTSEAGWYSGASTKYLKTGIILSHAYEWSGIVRYTGTPTGYRELMFGWKNRVISEAGSPNGLGRWYLGGHKLGAGAGGDNSTWWAGDAVTTNGVIAKSFLDVYLAGTKVSSITGTGSAIREIYILAANELDGVGHFTTATIVALAIYDEQLTSTQISNLTTAMNAL